jgi:hypothetical protein
LTKVGKKCYKKTMMETLNISLPKKLSAKVDEIVEKEGYVSRSEFFRTLLRLYFQLVRAKMKPLLPFFVPFKKQPLSKIKRELERTGLYKKDFIESVVSGLSKSSFYGD